MTKNAHLGAQGQKEQAVQAVVGKIVDYASARGWTADGPISPYLTGYEDKDRAGLLAKAVRKVDAFFLDQPLKRREYTSWSVVHGKRAWDVRSNDNPHKVDGQRVLPEDYGHGK